MANEQTGAGMSGRCKTCKHWEFNPDYPGVPNDTAPCRRTRHNGDFPEDDTSLANAFCGGESSVLFTHETFGCVQWEATE